MYAIIESILTTFPSIECSLTLHTFTALFSTSNTMNPNPRDLCVSRLNITSAEITLPYFSKYNRNSAAKRMEDV